jgi:hypothetical protein
MHAESHRQLLHQMHCTVSLCDCHVYTATRYTDELELLSLPLLQNVIAALIKAGFRAAHYSCLLLLLLLVLLLLLALGW